jgi:hypothetical protein
METADVVTTIVSTMRPPSPPEDFRHFSARSRQSGRNGRNRAEFWQDHPRSFSPTGYSEW